MYFIIKTNSAWIMYPVLLAVIFRSGLQVGNLNQSAYACERMVDLIDTEMKTKSTDFNISAANSKFFLKRSSFLTWLCQRCLDPILEYIDEVPVYDRKNELGVLTGFLIFLKQRRVPIIAEKNRNVRTLQERFFNILIKFPMQKK